MVTVNFLKFPLWFVKIIRFFLDLPSWKVHFPPINITKNSWKKAIIFKPLSQVMFIATYIDIHTFVGLVIYHTLTWLFGVPRYMPYINPMGNQFFHRGEQPTDSPDAAATKIQAAERGRAARSRSKPSDLFFSTGENLG